MRTMRSMDSRTPSLNTSTFAGPASAPPAPRAQAQQPKAESNIKDTIESILVAFILAFIFRAFIVEAFVIPTGSMAPTLLGAHMRFTCADCGYHFHTNYSARENDSEGNPIIPARSGPVVEKDASGRVRRVANTTHQVYCPNCAYKVPSSAATNVDVHYGDRILVLKYLYLFQEPQRWDVAVFKSPDDVDKYVQNYIKRLAGKPNESILLLDGDLYKSDGKGEEIGEFQIQDKPRHVQDALWRVVYDNDYRPRGMTRDRGKWKFPWVIRSGSGWDLGDESGNQRLFRFDNPQAGGSVTFEPQPNAANHPLTDWLAYDIETQWQPAPVSDLKLVFDYVRTSGEGPLRISLTKGDDAFTAEVTATEVKLIRQSGDAQTTIGAAALKVGTGRPARIELENVDYRVTLRVNGDDVLQTTREQYYPDPRRLLGAYERRELQPRPTVEISAERQSASVSHVSLWRDVYYINTRGASRTTKRDGEPQKSSPFWASPSSFPQNVIHLGPREYFVLGDNSLISGDARFWADDIRLPDFHVESGRVPDRFLLGKAFFVYWPAGYRPADFVPAITPNFGDMRFIR